MNFFHRYETIDIGLGKPPLVSVAATREGWVPARAYGLREGSVLKLAFVVFDSLNRLALEAYGGTVVETPNFNRLAERAVTFDRRDVGSLPRIPARRDIHTGRLSFMHRSWGPLEPYDNSFAQILKEAGTYTHLVSDHFHYFEDGGTGYHTRYNSWDFIRGQEYDPWKAMVQPPLERLREKFSQNHYDFSRKPHRMRHMVNLECAAVR